MSSLTMTSLNFQATVTAGGKDDTEAEQALAGAAQITSIPTLMALRDGILVFRQPGALAAAGLEQVIEGVRALGMEEIRAKIDVVKQTA